MANRERIRTHLETDLRRLAEGRHHDPHGVLGLHDDGVTAYVLLHIPSARDVRIEGIEAERLSGSDFFLWTGTRGELPRHYRVAWNDSHGGSFDQVDPYSFAPSLDPREVESW